MEDDQQDLENDLNNEEAFDDDAFGDLKTDNLPDFFTSNTKENLDDSMSILSLSSGKDYHKIYI